MEKDKLEYLSNTLELLFPRQEKHRKLALTLLLEIRDRQFTSSKYNSAEYHDFCRNHAIKESDYSYVLSILRDYGLVLKKGGHREGEYTVSTEFWDSMLKELHEFLASEK